MSWILIPEDLEIEASRKKQIQRIPELRLKHFHKMLGARKQAAWRSRKNGTHW
jgi:hypothetical protein